MLMKKRKAFYLNKIGNVTSVGLNRPITGIAPNTFDDTQAGFIVFPTLLC